MGVEGILGFVGVKFMVIGVCVLSKFAYSSKIGSLQLRLLQSSFSPRARGVAYPKLYGRSSDTGVLSQMLNVSALGLALMHGLEPPYARLLSVVSLCCTSSFMRLIWDRAHLIVLYPFLHATYMGSYLSQSSIVKDFLFKREYKYGSSNNKTLSI